MLGSFNSLNSTFRSSQLRPFVGKLEVEGKAFPQTVDFCISFQAVADILCFDVFDRTKDLIIQLLY